MLAEIAFDPFFPFGVFVRLWLLSRHGFSDLSFFTAKAARSRIRFVEGEW
jgi:hypothetical protein